jgi:hypothetical protein
LWPCTAVDGGVRLGNLFNLTEAGSLGRTAQSTSADKFVASVLPQLPSVRRSGAASLAEIADAFNELGVQSATGESGIAPPCAICQHERNPAKQRFYRREILYRMRTSAKERRPPPAAAASVLEGRSCVRALSEVRRLRQCRERDVGAYWRAARRRRQRLADAAAGHQPFRQRASVAVAPENV